MVLLLLALTALVTAAVVITFTIDMQIQILAVYGLTAYDTDHTTELTFIDWGALYRGNDTRRPETTGAFYYLDNTGEGKIWLSYSINDWPSGVMLEVYVRKMGTTSFEKLNPGDVSSFYLDEGEAAEWYMLVTVENDAEFGTFTPKLTWQGCDSSAG